MLILRRINYGIFHLLKIAVLLETQEAGSTGDYGLQACFRAIKQKDKRSYNKQRCRRKESRGPNQVTHKPKIAWTTRCCRSIGRSFIPCGFKGGSRPTNTCISKPLGTTVLLFSMIKFVRFSFNVYEYFASMSKYTKCVRCHRRPEGVVRSLGTEFTETRHAGAGTRTQVLSKRRKH